MIVSTNGSQDYWLFTQKRECIGNVPSGATEFLYHTIDGEAYIQDMYFIRQDMIREVPRKVQNPVMRQ